MLTIPSLLHPTTTGYRWSPSWDDNWDRGDRYNCLSLHLTQYDTYGDGTTQHSHHWLVPLANAADALLSVAAAVRQQPGLEAWKPLRSLLSRRLLTPALITFALSLRYREDKPQWYHLTERKTSARREKEFDKRWHRVPEWADGSYKAAFSLLSGGVPDTREWTERFLAAQYLQEHARQDGSWPGGIDQFMPYTDLAIPGDWKQSWDAFYHAAQLAQSHAYIGRLIESAQYNAQRAAELAA